MAQLLLIKFPALLAYPTFWSGLEETNEHVEQRTFLLFMNVCTLIHINDEVVLVFPCLSSQSETAIYKYRDADMHMHYSICLLADINAIHLFSIILDKNVKPFNSVQL